MAHEQEMSVGRVHGVKAVQEGPVDEVHAPPVAKRCDSRGITCLKETWDRLGNWNIFEPYVPSLACWTDYSTKDCIIGLTLHCFILSVMVLAVAAARLGWFCLKFACFVILNYAVFRGDITPIQEDTNEPITQEQIQDATIFDSSGLKIILLQNRTRKISGSVSHPTSSRSCDSGSDSSQDIFSVSSLR